MSRSSPNPHRPHHWDVSLTKGTWERIVGPFTQDAANKFATEWDGKDGLKATALPVHTPAQFRTHPTLPVQIY